MPASYRIPTQGPALGSSSMLMIATPPAGTSTERVTVCRPGALTRIS
jgi:hypothetical protein